MTKAAKVLGVLLLAASAAGAQTQTTASQGTTTNAKSAKSRHKAMEELEQEMQALSDKCDRLEKQMVDMQADAQRREAELQDADKRAATAQAEIDALGGQERARTQETQEQIGKNGQAVASLETAVSDLRTKAAAVTQTVQGDEKRAENPPSIAFMGVKLKPGGFLAAETVDRQHGIGGDVNTQFSGIPFSGNTAGMLSEFNASGRQSRVSLLAEGKLRGETLRGYEEGDFLSAGTTSNDNQSNSYTFRQRQLWAQAQLNSGWMITGGQMWSLATEYRSGLTNLAEAIPMTIDAQYNVGFTWERQYGFRVVRNFADHVFAGFAVEEAQTLNLGGHNLPALVYQQAGNPSGLYNSLSNYSFNYAPDLVAKVAFEPGFGHFEVFAIGRQFRARAFPNAAPMLTTTPYGPSSTSTTGAFTTRTAGGGVGANGRVMILDRRLELAAHGLAGDGIGRYSSSTLADATAHPDGTLELLAGGSALGSAEWHAARRLDVYAYYGGEYDKRAFYNTGYVVTQSPTTIYMPPVGQPILGGYGAPTNIVFGCNIEQVPAASANGGGDVPGSALGCTSDNRNIQEGTAGYWFRFYQGSRGSLQQGIQYSYVVRHTWQGVGLAADPFTGTPAITGSPKAIDNMFFTSFRYYLPR
jgi:Skp family chaperone for outer membrane proteins